MLAAVGRRGGAYPPHDHPILGRLTIRHRLGRDVLNGRDERRDLAVQPVCIDQE